MRDSMHLRHFSEIDQALHIVTMKNKDPNTLWRVNNKPNNYQELQLGQYIARLGQYGIRPGSIVQDRNLVPACLKCLLIDSTDPPSADHHQ